MGLSISLEEGWCKKWNKNAIQIFMLTSLQKTLSFFANFGNPAINHHQQQQINIFCTHSGNQFLDVFVMYLHKPFSMKSGHSARPSLSVFLLKVSGHKTLKAWFYYSCHNISLHKTQSYALSLITWSMEYLSSQ